MEQHRPAPLSALGGRPMPAALHFVRSHFPYPDVDDQWTVEVTGAVERPRSFTLDDLRGFPQRVGARRPGVRRASPHRALASGRGASLGRRRRQPGDLERPGARPRPRRGRPRGGGDPGRALRRRRRRRVRARDPARQGAPRGDDARAPVRRAGDPARAGRSAPRDRPGPLRRGLGQVAAAHRGRGGAVPWPLPVGGLLPLRGGRRPGRHRAERAAGLVARHRHGADAHRRRRLGRRDRPRRRAARRRPVGRSDARRPPRPVTPSRRGSSRSTSRGARTPPRRARPTTPGTRSPSGRSGTHGATRTRACTGSSSP